MKNEIIFNWYEENNILPEESVGFDEVGRGPLAGPVVAASVWLSQSFLDLLKSLNIEINDSKKLSSKKRKLVVEIVEEFSKKNDQNEQSYVKYAIAECTPQEIDELNILKASLFSMEKAYKKLKMKNLKIALVDGNKAPCLDDLDIFTIVKGDAQVPSIAIASILAKEYRDRLMCELSKEFPHYDWEHNVGYPTKKHLNAVEQFGITIHHRKSFAPIKNTQLKLI